MTNWAARLFARELERQLAPLGIAPAYMPVVFALADGSALSQKELAHRAAVEQPTMAATLNRMERDSLIGRRPDPLDRRSTLISLTPPALAQVEAVEAVVQRINALALHGLSPKEQAEYLRLLKKVTAVLAERDDDTQMPPHF
jgi:DNA-binding MarR family transcriptional regulator